MTQRFRRSRSVFGPTSAPFDFFRLADKHLKLHRASPGARRTLITRVRLQLSRPQISARAQGAFQRRAKQLRSKVRQPRARDWPVAESRNAQGVRQAADRAWLAGVHRSRAVDASNGGRHRACVPQVQTAPPEARRRRSLAPQQAHRRAASGPCPPALARRRVRHYCALFAEAATQHRNPEDARMHISWASRSRIRPHTSPHLDIRRTGET